MPVYDNNGTVNTQISKLYDNNGSVNTQIGKVYDNNGTTNSLIYTAYTEATQTIYSTSTRTGWWASFGAGTVEAGGYRYYIANSTSVEVFSPYIDLTDYTKITLSLFAQFPNGGSGNLLFGFCPQSNPNNYVWNQVTGTGTYGEWQGPSFSGTYDISALMGNHRIKQMLVATVSGANIYLGNSYFTYLIY